LAKALKNRIIVVHRMLR